MIVAAVALGLLIGLTLGALGAGGSILAVPVLVHVLELAVPVATATSLVAVGATAAVAAWGHRRRVEPALAAWFVTVGGAGALGGAALGRRLSDDVVLLAFSALIVVAAQRMLTACPSCTRVGERRAETGGDPVRPPRGPVAELAAIVAAGALVGFLTGLFGVGGGFVVVPVLTLVLGRDLPAAIATSLVVVAGNAAVALVWRGAGAVDWSVAVAFTLPMLLGGVAGSRVAGRLDAQRSLRAFAATLVVVAVGNAATVLV